MTKTWARRTVQASAIAAGVLLVSAGAAQAYGSDANTTGNIGVGTGNQAMAPVQAPIDICGNATSVLGVANAGCHGGSNATMTESAHGGSDLTSTGNMGVGNGNQVYAPIQAPISVCGNSTSVAGSATSGCKGGSDATLNNGHGAPDATTTGNLGALTGNQAILPVQAPVDVSGNATTVGGHSVAGSHGGSNALAWAGGHHKAAEALPGVPGGLPTAGVTNVPVGQVTGALPTNDLGNKLTSGGVDGVTGNLPTAGVTDGLPTAGVTDGITGKKPVKDVTKKATKVTKPATESGRVAEHGGADLTSTGNLGVGNGNQVYAPIQIPVDISGNSIAVGGVSTAGSHGGSNATQNH
ncbi:chaplin family protein [Stackebrandtia nassauensis]|uniref:Putative glycine-rich surface protein n=1 Tax=Stackebrandtia nassauensis (strain DSM 44728 / CIP 108903 / NRRL B-16338 / NBRC 102104 / LLR-40K-21) TaxID=446470 RepID=D3Q1J9_STANL|nr:chaplin family protein [Stackebrandtia nassauensis]ADD39847.1 putative glycine-rich surface protein [Stackebrandtia nassauensis DSM 44728]